MTHNNRTAAVESLLSEFGENPSFLATDGRPIIRFPNNQNFPLDDPAVKPWLKNSHLRHTGAIPSNAALSDALQLLRVRARSSGSFTPVALRMVADDAGSIYLDLANARNEIAHVTPDGWNITSFTPGATFVSARGLLPIPTPDTGAPHATLDALRPLLNCAPDANGNDAGWNGIVDWLTAALHPDRPCPVLILHGPPGSGKTTAARLLRSLIDPNCQPLAVLPSRGSALERHAESNRVLAFDHITRMSGSTADALCRLSSGAIGPSHPIILTVPRLDATDWQPRADLSARAITVHLPAIDNPRTPKELEAEFENLRPTLLSALLTKVSIEPKGIRPPADVHDVLFKASAEQDPLYKSIANFMQTKDQWTGTATDLLNEICVTLSPRALSHRLRILAPTLPVSVEFHRIHKGIRQITITKVLRPPAPTDPPAPPQHTAPTTENPKVGQTPRSAADPPVGPRPHTENLPSLQRTAPHIEKILDGPLYVVP